MYIARILYPIKVLGPGNRIGIWFDGCPHGCPGCSNPELWRISERYRADIRSIMQLIGLIADHNQVDGFTITGGDPFYQPESLAEILQEIKKINNDILVYTGYEYEEIKERHENIIKDIAVLIDGKYIEEENHGSLLRGSDNQRILILNTDYRDRYTDYLKTATNKIQNFSTGEGIISVGIHQPGYENVLEQISRSKGLEVKHE